MRLLIQVINTNTLRNGAMKTTLSPTLVAITLIGLCASATPDALAQGVLGWSKGFALPGTADQLQTLLPYDDGSGSQLYVGGEFQPNGGAAIGDINTQFIARWDGVKFGPLGTGMNG